MTTPEMPMTPDTSRGHQPNGETVNDTKTTPVDEIETLALEYTSDRVFDALSKFDKGRREKNSEGGYDAQWGKPYATVKCPGCEARIEITPTRPRPGRSPSALGFVKMTHPEPFNGCAAESHKGNLAATMIATKKIDQHLADDANGAVDVRLTRITRLLRGPEVEWLIPDIMERGMMASLYGPAGTGKSLLALEWAAKLATQGLSVAYLDEENPPELTDERLAAMGFNLSELHWSFQYYSFTGWTADTEEGAAKILRATKGADLVVFDSWNKFFASGSQANDAGALDAYRLTIKPLRAAGVGVLRLDHTGHGDVTRPAGSHVKLGDVDHNWQIRAKDVGDRRAEVVLVHQKSRTGRGADVIHLTREAGPVLRHVRDTSRSENVKELEGATDGEKVSKLVDILDEMGIATDASVRTAAAILKESGVKSRTDIINKAVRIRKAPTKSNG